MQATLYGQCVVKCKRLDDMPHPEPGQPTGALRSICPVACSLDLIGDRWTLLLIRDLFAGKTRFGELLASPEHIPTNILADRLKRLEHAKLISSAPYNAHPPRFEYRLTAAGRELQPVVDAIATWGLGQFPGTRRAARRQPPAPAQALEASPASVRPQNQKPRRKRAAATAAEAPSPAAETS
jgi:DNA-binding HxlR family transcriptional regulator